ncbi:uncharacterized protein [Physcomitrium patens]|uniref:F-box domain-containing protein n=1 Tax=Physcomitrium patens TaxID=3218 RepID=A0A2K1KET1_PHYPA|nr:uncharacterized protein LOC112283793 [Physcomitrium patens]XP_024378717.1 uncharacterized protein LOC112283793 [Physcomitrium patens]XP_024378718.1 uncharacterized protein LOC112283793 [Physcomitrium patens]PNR52286.1 hypothetical protein PHYPA_008660 [Physcomitrium patens]|eukprot:XP_024378716.1 uncharacterized protein LOC112283793 [Physcomitrella patens]
MKKVEPQLRLSRSRSSTAPSSSSRSNVDDDESLSMRSLDNTLPHPTSRRTAAPSKVLTRRNSLDQQASPNVLNRRASVGQQSSPNVPNRRVSLGQQTSPNLPNRRASLDQQGSGKSSTQKNPSRRVSVCKQSTASSLGKQITTKEADVVKSRFRHVSSKIRVDEKVKKSATRDTEVQAIAQDLPLDSLCLCLEKLQSVYHVVSCAQVCRHWRAAAFSDVIWRAFYLRWWHQEEDNGASSGSSQTTRMPSGFDTWRDAFKDKYTEGKRKIRSEVITHSVNAGWLHVRRMPDRRGKQVRDCMPGAAMRKIVDQLGLTFHVQINRDPVIRLKGKGSVVYFPGSCLLRYSTKTTKTGLSLKSVNSFKVTATSDRLLRHSCTIANFSGGQFEMLSREGHNSGPLRLLQHAPKHSTSLIIGTLFEGMHGIDGFSIEEHGEEQVLLLMVSLHLSDLIWTMMELGDGATPQISRRIFHDRLDPAYGLHNLHASIELHTFGKLLWKQEFRQVYRSPRESIPGQTAVFLLISSHEVFPGILTSPWRTEVFSGELRGVFMLDFTLWDPGLEIAWHCTRAVRTYPAELATVEYGPPGMDGERMHTGVQDEQQGVSVSMNLCVPFADGWGAKQDQENSVVITDLRFALTPKFMISWYGGSNL